MPALALPAADITPRAAADLLWLEQNLRRRYHGWEQDETGRFVVEVERANGKLVWCYGGTLELAVAAARATVRQGARR